MPRESHRLGGDSSHEALSPRLTQIVLCQINATGFLAGEIARFLDRDYDPEMRPDALTAPPGSPIGQ